MKLRNLAFTLCIMMISIAGNTEVSVKLKDLSFIDGLKENQVVGYGLVVGLQGTGDTKNSPLAGTSLKSLLKNLGLEADMFASKNAAAVLLTAKLPPFVRVGETVDVTVSSIGDAKSLDGGILVQSALKGADNAIYVVAQGPVSVSKSRGGGKAVNTVAYLSNGGVVEREINTELLNQENLVLVLKNWDYSVADAIVKGVSGLYADSKPEMIENGKIRITVVKSVPFTEFISSIQNIEVAPSQKARIVVIEKDGTLVAGGDVKISQAMVSREGMTVEIEGKNKKGSAALIKDAASVKDLVDVMNAIGASTADMIAILKALKEAGSLHAELIVR